MAIGLIYHKGVDSNSLRDLHSQLFRMNYAGQECHWTALSDGRTLHLDHQEGLADLETSAETKGFCGICQNSSKPRAEPIVYYSPGIGNFAFGFDGYIKNGDELREKWGGETDEELAARFIADARDVVKGIKNLYDAMKGHGNIVISTEKGQTYASRHPLGIRPLSTSQGSRGYAVATSSRAFFDIDMELTGDIEAGKIVAVDSSGIHELDDLGNREMICSFLWGYHTWVDCIVRGIPVNVVREDSAAILARKDKDVGLKIDIAAPVPDSGKAYAEGYAKEYGCHHSEPLVKDPYAGRSYLRHTQDRRDKVARVKITYIPSRAAGYIIALLEDSFRRGTQAVRKRGPIKLLQDAGAKEIHVRVGTPRNTRFCRFAPPDGERYEDEKLVANRFPTDEGLAGHLEVESVKFAEVDDFVDCITKRGTLERNNLCLGCYGHGFGPLDE